MDGGHLLDLENLKETIRLEIRKELKIKDGAENLQKVTRDKKARSDIGIILKNSNEKLDRLRSELTALLAQVPDDEGNSVHMLLLFLKLSC
jgi:protein kinase N